MTQLDLISFFSPIFFSFQFFSFCIFMISTSVLFGYLSYFKFFSVKKRFFLDSPNWNFCYNWFSSHVCFMNLPSYVFFFPLRICWSWILILYVFVTCFFFSLFLLNRADILCYHKKRERNILSQTVVIKNKNRWQIYAKSWRPKLRYLTHICVIVISVR